MSIEIDSDEDGISVSIDGRDVEVEDASEDCVLVRLSSIEELGQNTGRTVPSTLCIQVQNEHGFGTFLFHEAEIAGCATGAVVALICHHPNKYWEHHYGLATLLGAIRDQLPARPSLAVREIELEDDWKRLVIERLIGADERIADALAALAADLIATIREAEIALGGMTWKRDYDTNERLFCTEVLLPLLRRMKFIDVRYTQGAREYGKDFTFSEGTPFGSLRHYAIQAKAGDVRGNVQGDVDELIGQLDDAFKMPYLELGSSEPRYISTFIIAISGSFTENARQKIANKIPRGLFGSVYFLDRDRILDLVERYWRK